MLNIRLLALLKRFRCASAMPPLTRGSPMTRGRKPRQAFRCLKPLKPATNALQEMEDRLEQAILAQAAVSACHAG